MKKLTFKEAYRNARINLYLERLFTFKFSRLKDVKIDACILASLYIKPKTKEELLLELNLIK